MSFQSSIALEDKNNGKNRQGYLLRERERESEMTYLAVVSLRGHCKIVDEKRNEAGNLLMVLCCCVWLDHTLNLQGIPHPPENPTSLNSSVLKGSHVQVTPPGACLFKYWNPFFPTKNLLQLQKDSPPRLCGMTWTCCVGDLDIIMVVAAAAKLFKAESETHNSNQERTTWCKWFLSWGFFFLDSVPSTDYRQPKYDENSGITCMHARMLKYIVALKQKTFLL